MAKDTKISWTDSTFNPWWGCTAVSPGCDRCYADKWDRRCGGDHWGPGKPRRLLSASHWAEPLAWDREAQVHGDRHWVFCASMCDWADREAPVGQRERLWPLIKRTPNLIWLMLTKRPGNFRRYLPKDWGAGYPNVWLGVSVENRKHGLPRIDTLRTNPATKRFLSVEPLLEDLGTIDLTGIDWVIVGGESGGEARPMKAAWVHGIRRQCGEQDVAFFFKQWGGSAKDKGGSLIGGREVKEFPPLE